MKSLLKIPVIAAAVAIASCTGNTESEKRPKETDTVSEATQPVQSIKPVIQNEKLNAIYEQYMLLTAALTDGDILTAKIAANAIEAGVDRIEGGAKLASSAAKITEADNIESQREAFETLTNHLNKVIRKEGLSEGTLYLAYCPMAFNDKGASWLTSSKAIRNPYFGEKMLSCGEVKEVIN